MRPWVDEGADPALPSPGLVGERGHASVRQLEEDDPEGPDVRLEPDLDPRLRGLGQDAVLVLVGYTVAIWNLDWQLLNERFCPDNIPLGASIYDVCKIFGILDPPPFPLSAFHATYQTVCPQNQPIP